MAETPHYITTQLLPELVLSLLLVVTLGVVASRMLGRGLSLFRVCADVFGACVCG